MLKELHEGFGTIRYFFELKIGYFFELKIVCIEVHVLLRDPTRFGG